MTKALNPDLEKLSTRELRQLFLDESQEFLSLLNKESTDPNELQKLKGRIREILDLLDERRNA